MCTQWVFRGCSHSLIDIHMHSQAFRACSVLAQRFLKHTYKHSGGVQYSLKGTHMHSQAFRASPVLTQMRSFSWSHYSELCSIMTQWHSCVLSRCSHSLNGIHPQSMGSQGLFPLTHWHSRALASIQEVFNMCSACPCP